ncbi:hypothetical protein ABZY10_29220 [Streptomyces sp. NPDC006539]|uniref:hypothetical protein n=1 Tax=Streptomyces sp. NPDC006539 TaxID=3155352 RepID=UPI0033B6A219
MAEISYRELLATIARLIAATSAEAQAADQRRARIEAKATESHAVIGRLTELDFDEDTRRDIATIAANFTGQARGAVEAANAARDLNTGAQDAADTVQKNHGGMHSAVQSAPVAPAKNTAYTRL